MMDIRDRIKDGFNRARIRLELKRSIAPAMVVLASLAIGAGLIVYVVTNISRSALTATYVAKFEVADATAVQSGVNEVRFKGIPVGTITATEIDGDRAVLTTKVQSKYGRIYRDARAELRPNTALQDIFLDIVDRGTEEAGVLPGDDALTLNRTAVPVNVSDVLNVFRPNVQARLRTLMDDLGNGLEDRGRTLQEIFVEAVPFIQVAGRLSDQLARREPLVRRLVRQTAVLAHELGQRDNELRTLVREGSTTLGTLRNSSSDLDATLTELPPTLTRLDDSFTTVSGVLGDVDGAVRSLRPVADRLPESLRDLEAVGNDADPAVRALQRPVSDLVPLAEALEPLAGDLDDAIRSLAPQIDTVDYVTDAAERCKTGTQNFFQWNASISKFGDARGPIPRGNVVIGAQSSGIFNDPQEYAPESCAGGEILGSGVPNRKDMR